MRLISIIFGLTFSLIITPAIAEESRSFWIGYIVTYADLCSHYVGHTVDFSRMREIREAYEDDKDFQRGYKRWRRLFNADAVRGLNDCEMMLDRFAEIDVESRFKEPPKSALSGSTAGTSTVGGSTRYRDYDDKMLCPLALAGGGTRWETRQTWLPAVEEAQRRGFSVEDCRNIAASKGPSTETRPIAVEWDGYRSLFAGYIELSDTGREGRISATLPDNEGTCSGTYRYDDDRHGTWSIACTNGLAASGEVQRYGKGQGSSGEGVDARGNKVRFTVGAAVGRTYRPAQTLMRISRRSASATEAYAAAGADLRDGAAVGPLETNFGHW